MTEKELRSMGAPRVEHWPTVSAARQELACMGVGKAGCEIMAPKGVFRVIRLHDVPLRAALIIKQEMLSKGGEAALPWDAASLKCDTCPVLLSGTVRQYDDVMGTLQRQPFGLRRLADQIEQVLANYEQVPPPTPVAGKELEWGKHTYIMGILNVTPDSFSDGGEFNSFDAAIEHAQEMIEAGAHIIDVGGESSRPGAAAVSDSEELARVSPVVKWLSGNTDVLISVDTYKADVARACLDLGAHIINDISALGDPDMVHVAAEYRAPVILMHMKGMPRDMQVSPTYDDVLEEVYDYLHERIAFAQEHGVPACNIIVDPGIGFGKTAEHNIELLRRLNEFVGLGKPILVGTSRKSTIGTVTGAKVDDRIHGTAATVALAIASGASIVRVHDVREMAMVGKMTDAIVRGWRRGEDGHAG